MSRQNCLSISFCVPLVFIKAPGGAGKDVFVSAIEAAIFKRQSSYWKNHALGTKSRKYQPLVRIIAIVQTPKGGRTKTSFSRGRTKTSFFHYSHYKLNSGHVLPMHGKPWSRNPLVTLVLSYDLAFIVICDFHAYTKHATSPVIAHRDVKGITPLLYHYLENHGQGVQ